MDDPATRTLMAQIDALSISASDPSLDTTIVGIGSLTGRVLMALGELTLRGVETVNLRIKLRTLASKLAQQDKTAMSDAAYDLLLEFQRAGLYSDSVRFAAWDLILGEMELGQTEGIIGGVLRWPWIEIEVFIRQLALARSKEWVFYPGSTVERRFRNSRRLDRKSTPGMTTQSFRSMLKAILFHCQTDFDLEKMITIEDLDSRSTILDLSPKELNRTLDWLAQRTLPEIRQFVQQILILPLQRGGQNTAYRVVYVISRFWRREPNLMRAVVPLDQIAPFLAVDSDILSSEETVGALPEMPYYNSLLAVAKKIQTLPDLEQYIFVLAAATEPMVLMLPSPSMQRFLSVVKSLSSSRTSRYLNTLIFSKTPNWSRYPAPLSSQIVYNLVELLETIQQASDPAVRQLLPLERILEFVPDEIMRNSDHTVLRALLRNVTTMDHLDILHPVIHTSRGLITILQWTDGTRAFLRALHEGDKSLSDIQPYLQQLVFPASFGPSMLQEIDWKDSLANNFIALVAELWNKYPSGIGMVLKTEWIVAICSIMNVHDPSHKLFQVALQLSREPKDLELVDSLPSTSSTAGITDWLDGLTTSRTEFYLHQVTLYKATQWSESVDDEAAMEQILHIFVHVWKREHAIVDRFLDCVYGMQPTSKYGEAVMDIAQCITIALLNNINQLSDLHDLMPQLLRASMPIFLLTSTNGLKNLLRLLLLEDRGELERYLEAIVMFKLNACAHHPAKVRQRIVRNLLEMVAVLWKPYMRIKCPNLDMNLTWIMDSFLPTRQASTEEGTIDWQFVILMNCISSATNLPLSVKQLPFEEAVNRLHDLSTLLSRQASTNGLQDLSKPSYLRSRNSLQGTRSPDLTSGDIEANIWIYLRCLLHHISSSPSMGLLPTGRTYDVLLRILRTHPRGAVQIAIWDIILLELERGDARNLIDPFLRRSDAEVGGILRQLKDMKKSEWGVFLRRRIAE